MKYIRTLNQVQYSETGIYGARACDLAKLLASRIPIPPTLVITSAAWDIIIEGQLRYKIEFILQHLDFSSEQTLQNAYNTVRKQLLEIAIPDEVLAELREAYESLSVNKGQAADEMLRQEMAPFVNMYASPNYTVAAESYEGIIQNVHGFDEFILALREIYAMQFTPESLRYRREHGISSSTLKTAIIVQEMKPAEASATAYSTDPQEQEMIFVHTYKGYTDLRDLVAKDFFHVKKDFLTIAANQVVEQSKIIVRGEDDELMPIEYHEGRGQSLNDKQVMEVARYAKKAEAELKNPVKCFLTISKGEYWLLFANRYGVPSRPSAKGTLAELRPEQEQPTAAPPTEARPEPVPETTPEPVPEREPEQPVPEEPHHDLQEGFEHRNPESAPEEPEPVVKPEPKMTPEAYAAGVAGLSSATVGDVAGTIAEDQEDPQRHGTDGEPAAEEGKYPEESDVEQGQVEEEPDEEDDAEDDRPEDLDEDDLEEDDSGEGDSDEDDEQEDEEPDDDTEDDDEDDDEEEDNDEDNNEDEDDIDDDEKEPEEDDEQETEEDMDEEDPEEDDEEGDNNDEDDDDDDEETDDIDDEEEDDDDYDEDVEDEDNDEESDDDTEDDDEETDDDDVEDEDDDQEDDDEEEDNDEEEDDEQEDEEPDDDTEDDDEDDDEEEDDNDEDDDDYDEDVEDEDNDDDIDDEETDEDDDKEENDEKEPEEDDTEDEDDEEDDDEEEPDDEEPDDNTEDDDEDNDDVEDEDDEEEDDNDEDEDDIDDDEEAEGQEEEPEQPATKKVIAPNEHGLPTSDEDDNTKEMLNKSFRIIYAELAKLYERTGESAPDTLTTIVQKGTQQGIFKIDNLHEALNIKRKIRTGEPIDEEEKNLVLGILNELLARD